MQLQVECRAGSRGEQVPDRFHLDGRSVEVTEILDQWDGTDYLYFKLRGADGNLYILKYDETEAQWELTLYESPKGSGLAGQVPQPGKPL